MTDEELAVILRDAYDDAKPNAWIEGIDDDPATRYAPRVTQRWVMVVKAVRRLEHGKRAQMAASVAGALLQAHAGISNETAAVRAVLITDLLQKELAK